MGVVSDFDLLSLEGVQGKMEVRLFEQGGRALGGERCHLEQLLRSYMGGRGPRRVSCELALAPQCVLAFDFALPGVYAETVLLVCGS